MIRNEALITLKSVFVFLGLPRTANILVGSSEFRAIKNQKFSWGHVGILKLLR